MKQRSFWLAKYFSIFAQLASAQLSEREVSGSIFSLGIHCFSFCLVAYRTRLKTILRLKNNLVPRSARPFDKWSGSRSTGNNKHILHSDLRPSVFSAPEEGRLHWLNGLLVVQDTDKVVQTHYAFR